MESQDIIRNTGAITLPKAIRNALIADKFSGDIPSMERHLYSKLERKWSQLCVQYQDLRTGQVDLRKTKLPQAIVEVFISRYIKRAARLVHEDTVRCFEQMNTFTRNPNPS